MPSPAAAPPGASQQLVPVPVASGGATALSPAVILRKGNIKIITKNDQYWLSKKRPVTYSGAYAGTEDRADALVVFVEEKSPDSVIFRLGVSVSSHVVSSGLAHFFKKG